MIAEQNTKYVWIVPLVFIALLHPVDAKPAPDVPADAQRVLAAFVHPLDQDRISHPEGGTRLVEIYTASWCPVCAEAERALDRLFNESIDAQDSMTLLAYHPWPDRSDPLGFAEGDARMTERFGAVAFPTIWVDGMWKDSAATRPMDVSEGLEEVFYQSLQNMLGWANDVPRDLTALTEVGPSSEQGLAITVTSSSSLAGPLVVTPVLWEDPVQHNERVHRLVARGTLEPHTILKVEADAPIRLTWNLGTEPAEGRLGVTIIVEEAPRRETATVPAVSVVSVLGALVSAAVLTAALRRA
ncbi:MAG: glutaredoxin [Euryarchaeota archaeon]|nr:glutaredoxin [Euryarchaeota archaeon]